MSEYDRHQYVGVDLHRRRSVIVRQTENGVQLSAVRILNDPVALGLQIEQAGRNPDVVLEGCTSGAPRSGSGSRSRPCHGRSSSSNADSGQRCWIGPAAPSR